MFGGNYPYSIPEYFVLKNSDFPFSYGNFFNWEIEHEDFYCKSEKTPVVVTVSDVVSVKRKTSKVLKVYPVPFEDHVILETEAMGDVKVDVYDALGLFLKSSEFRNGNTIELSLSEFNQKVFFLKVQDGNFTETIKVVKK